MRGRGGEVEAGTGSRNVRHMDSSWSRACGLPGRVGWEVRTHLSTSQDSAMTAGIVKQSSSVTDVMLVYW